MIIPKGMGQAAPFGCPAGFIYTNPGNTIIPSNPSATELVALQGAFCVNSSGGYQMATQTLPITVALSAAAVAVALFLLGLSKILATIPAYMAFQNYRCSASGKRIGLRGQPMNARASCKETPTCRNSRAAQDERTSLSNQGGKYTIEPEGIRN